MSEENKNEQEAQEKTEETAEEKPEASEEKKEESTSLDAQQADEGEEVEVPEKFKALVDGIEKMSVLELHELVKLLEKKFGVSAAAVAVAPGAGGDEGAGAEEKSEFTVELKEAGDQKIGVIKAVKEALGLGLKEAKELVDGAPAVIKEAMKKEEAEELKAKIEEVGGKVELK